jgi:UDP-glucose 4-epimerase
LGKKVTAGTKEIWLHGTGEETRDFLHVEDAARLVPAVVEQVQGTPILVNGGSGNPISVRDLSETFVRLLGKETAIRFTGKERSGDPAHYQADVILLQKLGFNPNWNLKEGLRDYANWFMKLHKNWSG